MNAPAKTFNPWPYGIVAVFVVFITSIATVVTYVSRHRVDLVSADYYEQEIRYQQRLDQMNRTAALGVSASVSFNATTREVRVQLPGPVSAGDRFEGRLQLYRPSAAGMDREIALVPDARGVQAFPAPDLAPGAWKARVHWTQNGQAYYAEQPLVIPVAATAR
jgi:hypothetical protein